MIAVKLREIAGVVEQGASSVQNLAMRTGHGELKYLHERGRFKASISEADSVADALHQVRQGHKACLAIYHFDGVDPQSWQRG